MGWDGREKITCARSCVCAMIILCWVSVGRDIVLGVCGQGHAPGGHSPILLVLYHSPPKKVPTLGEVCSTAESPMRGVEKARPVVYCARTTRDGRWQ